MRTAPCEAKLRAAKLLGWRLMRLAPRISVMPVSAAAPRLAAFERAIANCDEVMECYLMTEAFDYMLRVVAGDISGIERFVMTKLTKIDCVRDIHTSVALRRVEYKTALPVRVRDE